MVWYFFIHTHKHLRSDNDDGNNGDNILGNGNDTDQMMMIMMIMIIIKKAKRINQNIGIRSIILYFFWLKPEKKILFSSFCLVYFMTKNN